MILRMILLLFQLLCCGVAVHSFQSTASSWQRARKGRSTIVAAISYPVKTSNVLTKMTQTTQKALQDRTSRMEIELPPGSDFGVEASSKKASRRDPTKESNTDRLKRSNREAVRLVADMFSVISSQTVALFPSEAEASDARVKWGPTFRGQLYSIDAPAQSKAFGNLYSKRVSKQEQEQALLGSDGGIYIPDNTELVIVCGPRAKDIKKLKKLHEKLGEGTCIILINSRASVEAAAADALEKGSDDPQWVAQAFTPVFHYAPPLLGSQTSDRDLLLYHEYKGPWYLAEKEKPDDKGGILGSIGGMLSGAGSFKTIWEGAVRPTATDVNVVLSGGVVPAPAAAAAIDSQSG